MYRPNLVLVSLKSLFSVLNCQFEKYIELKYYDIIGEDLREEHIKAKRGKDGKNSGGKIKTDFTQLNLKNIQAFSSLPQFIWKFHYARN